MIGSGRRDAVHQGGGKGGKDGKDSGKGGKRQKGVGKDDSKGGKGGGGLTNRRRFVFKALCTDPLAANIIGHAGKTRTGIEEESGCSIWISKRDEFFPQSQCRLLLLHADAPSQVLSAIEHTVARLEEVADADRSKGLEVETPLIGKEAGEYIYRMVLPSFIRGKMIGTGGANIKQLREETGAKIFVDNEVYDGHQFARVIGPKEVISQTLARINDLVQEEVDAPEYEGWASVQWFSGELGGKGGGGHKDAPRREAPAGKGGHDRSPPRGKSGKGGKAGDRSPPRGKGGGHERGRARSRSERRHRSPERQQPPPPERHEPPQGSPIEAIERLCEKFPDGAAQMDHAVSCDLPKAAVGQILGEDERYKLRVERETGTIISVDTSPGPDHLTIMVTGPLLWVYVAHCMVMSRYHELEQEKENRRRGDEASDNTISRVEELQAQLLALQGQLAEVTRSKGSAKGSGRR